MCNGLASVGRRGLPGVRGGAGEKAGTKKTMEEIAPNDALPSRRPKMCLFPSRSYGDNFKYRKKPCLPTDLNASDCHARRLPFPAI